MNLEASITAAWEKIQGMIDGLIVMLPNLVLALIVFVLFVVVARFVRNLVRRVTRNRRNARNLGLVLGRLAQGSIILIG
jgi:small conductance mechanosensitive channel